jgi:hypothetical protein
LKQHRTRAADRPGGLPKMLLLAQRAGGIR